MTRPVLIDGMKGLGDNIYQRAFVRSLVDAGEDVFLSTPWPELYEDLPVRFVKLRTPLRTQAANIARQPPERWTTPPRDARVIHASYGTTTLHKGTIVTGLEQCFGVPPAGWDLPPLGPCPVTADRPIAVVRPVTLRMEWSNPARNPEPAYINQLVWVLRGMGFHVVSIADLRKNEEWLVGDPPPADTILHDGQLTVRQTLALVASAHIAVGGIGWLTPACIAASTPLYAVLGGQGGHNAPEKITHPSMDLTRVGWATPARYCRCVDMRHRCNKTINDIEGGFHRWIKSLPT